MKIYPLLMTLLLLVICRIRLFLCPPNEISKKDKIEIQIDIYSAAIFIELTIITILKST